MVLFSSKATLESAGSLFGHILRQEFALFFIFSSSSFAFEVRGNMVLGTILPVFVGCIDAICPYDIYSSGKPSSQED